MAVITMVIDHYGKIVAPDWYFPTHMIGRAAFPLFAWIIANRLAIRPDLAMQYIRWLLPWAVVSQPAFFLAGREWYEPNIMFELLAGVVIVYAIQVYGRTARTLLIGALLTTLGWFFDYGPAGVLSIPLLFLAAQNSAPRAMAWLALIALAVNLPAADLQGWLAAFAALGAPVIALLSLSLAGYSLPRLPKPGFYLFYPLHLLVLAALSQL